MLVIIDYGVGNLHSVKSACDLLGIQNKMGKTEDDIKNADALLLPGVGAYRDAMQSLKDSKLIPSIMEAVKKGVPLLGICLGMQLLYEKSYENGEYEGLGLLKGSVCSIKEDLKQNLKVPHMGWNKLDFHKESPILKYIDEKDSVYYVHSYYVKSDGSELIASSEYDITIPGIVNKENIYGMQFHPEKSGNVGLNLLKAYGELIK